MNIVPTSQNNFTAAIRLLESNGLPTSDINSKTLMFVIEEGSKVIATVAVEYHNNYALLRSLCVDDEHRNKGLGEKLVSFIENYILKRKVQFVFILTTTAANFFFKRGYTKIERSEVPAFIQGTSEFSVICPSTATVMKKQLA